MCGTFSGLLAGLWGQIRRLPVVVSAAAGIATLLAAAAAAEGIWSLFSSDPLIPGVGRVIREWFDEGARILALLALVALAVALVRLQVAIYRQTREKDDLEAPTDIRRLEGVVFAGADFTVTISVEDPTHPGSDSTIGASNASFTAKQGRRMQERRVGP
jgi:hypothetical protein